MLNENPLSRRHFLQTTSAAASVAALTHSISARAYAVEAKDGWIELFDGKTLKGWHKNPTRIGHGTGGTWQVEDGTITGEQDPPGSGNGGILLTDQKFGDFELQLDIKPDWGVCSGLFLRANDRGQCIQMMVDYHDAGNVGHLYGEGTGGWNTRTFDVNGKYEGDQKLVALTSANPKTVAAAGLISSCSAEDWLKSWKLNDWNAVKVVATGKYPKITTWINGLQVCEFDGDKSNVERYKKDDVLSSLTATGSIAVQVHGGKGWPNGAKCRWKNIRVRPLT
ncbi:MAG TPA: DUF1080 domain-containing protein [Pirellulaceae bacterium]|nr:DUF1080 domain-containing protein [Pirellulaceae bacterium]